MGIVEREDMLREFVDNKDDLVVSLWSAFRNISDYITPDDFSDEDWELWETLTKHSAVQSKLGNKYV